MSSYENVMKRTTKKKIITIILVILKGLNQRSNLKNELEHEIPLTLSFGSMKYHSPLSFGMEFVLPNMEQNHCNSYLKNIWSYISSKILTFMNIYYLKTWKLKPFDGLLFFCCGRHLLFFHGVQGTHFKKKHTFPFE